MRVQVEHLFFPQRLKFATAFVVMVITILAVRLYYLQGIMGAHYRDLSENNRTRTVRVSPPRGIIYDRNQQILVHNRPEYNVSLLVEDIANLDELLQRLAEISGRSVESLQETLRGQRRSLRPFEPKVVMPDISFEELAKLKTQMYRLPGVIIDVSPTRFYPYGSLGAQMLGYTLEITKAQLDKVSAAAPSEPGKEYLQGDMFGQSGLERSFEQWLRGTAGYRRVEVDAHGNRRAELGIVDSRPGRDLHLTIDLDVQRAAEEAFGEQKGAAVAIDPRNGEVLALVSMPTFDANIFSGQIKSAEWQKVKLDKRHPLNNRAISAAYAPGSTFKLMMTLAGLAEGKITPHSTAYCPGFFYFAGRPYRCHKKTGHGTVDLRTAVTVSCDVFFYQLGHNLGINKIHDYSKELGLGRLTEIPLPSEKKGTLPSEQWKLTHLGQRWYPGETLSVAIGQGYLTVTPIEMAVAMAAIANGGKTFKPLLVKKIIDPMQIAKTDTVTAAAAREPQAAVDVGKGEAAAVQTFEPELLWESKLSPDLYKIVREDALSVVSDARGTGRRAALPGIAVAGKTGTAQVVSLGKEKLGKHLDDHAWFIAFAPFDDPQIALAVIVENGGHGGAVAAPISQKIMAAYFKKKGMLPPDFEPGVSGTSAHSADGSSSAAATAAVAASAGTPAASQRRSAGASSSVDGVDDGLSD